ncbi:MAG: hypothetical protein ACR2NZ_20980 [Rubripirellula sp.]
MSFRDCLIVERVDDWFIVVGSETEVVAHSVSDDELVTCVKLMIQLAGLQNPHCILAPASRNCFFTAFATGNDLDARDRDALTYELEDHLPLDAESMVADFVVLPDSATASIRKSSREDGLSGLKESADQESQWVSAVAIESTRWQMIANAFELEGIQVRSIIPSAALATRSLCQSHSFTEVVELILCNSGRADLVTVGSESILGWKHLHLDASALRRHKLLDAPQADATIAVGAEPESKALIDEVYGPTDTESEPLEVHWIRGATLSLSKQNSRWFDLRRDQLAPADPLRPIARQLRWVGFSIAACLLAMILGGWWRSQRISDEIEQVRSEQQTAFKQTFPGVRTPAALMRRVTSEHARVMGSRGASTQVEVPRSAPIVLRDLLQGLPDDVRFRITSLSILNGRVDLDLQVRSPVDAGALATSLSNAGFDVEPPVTTQKDAKTFDSVLEANWVGIPATNGPDDRSSVHVSVHHEVSG